MRRLLFAVAVGLCAIATCQMDMAAPRGKTMVLAMPGVKRELKVTKEQDRLMKAAMDEMSRTGMSGDPTQMMAGNPLTMMDDKILPFLSPEQVSRLTEIWIQYEGPAVLSVKEIAEALKLTAAQKTGVKEKMEAFNSLAMGLLTSGHVSNGTVKDIKNKRGEMGTAILALLDADQTKAFAAMQGKPFKLPAKRDI